MAFRKSYFGWVNITRVSSVVSGPNFTISFVNVGGVVVDQLLFQFSISPSDQEIFAIKV